MSSGGRVGSNGPPSTTSSSITAVPPEPTATRTFTVHNDGFIVGSQVKFTADAGGPGSPFTVDCPPTEPACDLGPEGSRDVTITFAPREPGHAQAVVEIITTASNR